MSDRVDYIAWDWFLLPPNHRVRRDLQTFRDMLTPDLAGSFDLVVVGLILAVADESPPPRPTVPTVAEVKAAIVAVLETGVIHQEEVYLAEAMASGELAGPHDLLLAYRTLALYVGISLD